MSKSQLLMGFWIVWALLVVVRIVRHERTKRWIDLAPLAVLLLLSPFAVWRQQRADLQASQKADSLCQVNRKADHAELVSLRKAVSTLASQPQPTCYVRVDGAFDSLIVENTGAPYKSVHVEPLLLFDVYPKRQPGPEHRVSFLIADYYGERVDEDYEGNQRFAYGLSGSVQNYSFVDDLRQRTAEGLRERGLSWGGIGSTRAVRIVYQGWLGTQRESYFWQDHLSYDRDIALRPTLATKWVRIHNVADSLLSCGHVLSLKRMNINEATRRVMDACLKSLDVARQ